MTMCQTGNPDQWSEVIFDPLMDIPQPAAFCFLRCVASHLYRNGIEGTLVADFEVGGLYVEITQSHYRPLILIQWADRVLPDRLVGCVINWGTDETAMDEMMYFATPTVCQEILDLLFEGSDPQTLQRECSRERLIFEYKQENKKGDRSDRSL